MQTERTTTQQSSSRSIGGACATDDVTSPISSSSRTEAAAIARGASRSQEITIFGLLMKRKQKTEKKTPLFEHLQKREYEHFGWDLVSVRRDGRCSVVLPFCDFLLLPRGIR